MGMFRKHFDLKKKTCIKILVKQKQKSTENTQNKNRFILTRLPILYKFTTLFFPSQKINI